MRQGSRDPAVGLPWPLGGSLPEPPLPVGPVAPPTRSDHVPPAEVVAVTDSIEQSDRQPDRLDVLLTCSECGNRQQGTIHQNDRTQATVGIGCPECRETTEHRVGAPQWFK